MLYVSMCILSTSFNRNIISRIYLSIHFYLSLLHSLTHLNHSLTQLAHSLINQMGFYLNLPCKRADISNDRYEYSAEQALVVLFVKDDIIKFQSQTRFASHWLLSSNFLLLTLPTSQNATNKINELPKWRFVDDGITEY